MAGGSAVGDDGDGVDGMASGRGDARPAPAYRPHLNGPGTLKRASSAVRARRRRRRTPRLGSRCPGHVGGAEQPAARPHLPSVSSTGPETVPRIARWSWFTVGTPIFTVQTPCGVVDTYGSLGNGGPGKVGGPGGIRTHDGLAWLATPLTGGCKPPAFDRFATGPCETVGRLGDSRWGAHSN